jgi:hypothetical protein
VPLYEEVRRSGGIAPCIINLGIRWRWVVSFTPWLFYSWWKPLRYSLDRRLGRSGNLSGHWRWENSLFPARIRIQIPRHCSCWVVFFASLSIALVTISFSHSLSFSFLIFYLFPCLFSVFIFHYLFVSLLPPIWYVVRLFVFLFFSLAASTDCSLSLSVSECVLFAWDSSHYPPSRQATGPWVH